MIENCSSSSSSTDIALEHFHLLGSDRSVCNNHVVITGALPADVRCFPRVVCEGGVLDRVYTPEQCCIEHPRGVAYDYSGQIEKCHACEGTP